MANPNWGGARRGCGRKPNGSRAGMTHRPRPDFTRAPVHVSTHVADDVYGLRRRDIYRALHVAVIAGCQRAGFRVIEYSVQANHLHLICEGDDRQALARGLQALFTRVARAINRTRCRSGRVLRDRYHSRVLYTPREVRNALAYVLNNARKHVADRGRVKPSGWVDLCSSAPGFYGLERRWLPVAATPMLRYGWREAGTIQRDEVPGGRRPPPRPQ